MNPNAVIKGIYTLFKGSALQTALGGTKLYYKKIPQGTALPYADVDFVTGTMEQNFTEEQDTAIVLFRIFDNDRSDAGSLCDTLTTLYDNATLTVTSWRHLSMVRDFILPVDDLDNPEAPVFGWAIQYNVMIEKNT